MRGETHRAKTSGGVLSRLWPGIEKSDSITSVLTPKEFHAAVETAQLMGASPSPPEIIAFSTPSV